uniref:Baseplate wedge subunit n=1 Tax=Salmonella phage vB_SEnST11_KE23 TaxID=3161174 RepID=A0AAU8GIV9_9CAUD
MVQSVMAKFKFPKKDLNEVWWIERHDMVMAGYTYQRKRVFVVCAKTKDDARESMQQFIERSCE